MQDKNHKQVVEDCRKKLGGTHNCMKESPIYRDGWHFLDLECHPFHSDKFKSAALEIESKSSRPQKESNYRDLLEWKKKNPVDSEIFQIENEDQLNTSKLSKPQKFMNSNFRRWK
jgi:hypothetical protein